MNTVVIQVDTPTTIVVGPQGPAGPPGSGGLVSFDSLVTVWNNGDPQMVFDKNGDLVTNDVT